eukprot:c29055_g2_i1 orf=610-3447(+)
MHSAAMSNKSNRKVVVEVCYAHNLMPKDGQGSSSPFVEVDFDSQRQRTKTKTKDLNPTWNEKLVFNVSDPSNMANETVEVNVYNEKKTNQRNFLGRVKIPGSSIVKQSEVSMIPYPLDKRGLFSHIKGELFMKIYYYDETTQKQGEKSKDEKKQAAEDKQMSQLHVAEAKKPESKHYSAAAMTVPTEPVDFSLRETNPHLGSQSWEKASTYDLVEQMEYLFVRVVKARNLTAKDLAIGSSDPYVNVKVGNHLAKTRVFEKSVNPEWNEVFAFGKDKFQAPMVEIIVKDKDMLKDEFLGQVSFEIAEVPTRVPPDSPLAPEWYKLEKKGGGKIAGEIMLSIWKGTQADEAFPEAWQSDTGGHSHTRSKVYLSPRLWYLRVNVIEAQDLLPYDKSRFPEVSVRVQLGFQILKTRIASNRSTSPFWNEDLMFVAAEPFEEHLLLSVEDRISANKDEVLGKVQIPLSTVERRVDHRQVNSRWFNVEKGGEKKDGKFMSRIHLRICLDGGYHVLDESTHHSSDMRPTSRQIWKSPIGVLELGILSATGLLPMKTRDSRGCTDTYCVAKYGQKWVRTRTVIENLNPKWNEQYTWEVFDPCTVLSVGVFDNCHLQNGSAEKAGGAKDTRIGKVRIRLSTLESDRVYTHSYPLLVLQPSGVKKMGELELAVRFSCSSLLNMMHIYTRPLLPKMHYLHPLGVAQLENLRSSAMKIVALRLSRAEPPLRHEVVQFMLDVDSNLWSMRRSKANWFRIMGVLSGLIAVGKWFNDISEWKNPVTTVLVHVLFLILVWYPELILPTIFLYMFLIGAWNYRFRPRFPPHMDPRLSHAESVEPDELDEEFDPIPTNKAHEIVKTRYDRLRSVAGRIQTVLGDIATQGERFQALLSWRDPRATTIFIVFCLLAAIILYVTPFRVLAVLFGIYALRHPRFRDKMPGVHMNFLRRLPALSDRML